MADWRPMESAPKDGTSILVEDARGGVREVSWFDSWYGDKESPGWMVANCDEEYGGYIEAVNWMPMPKPSSQ